MARSIIYRFLRALARALIRSFIHLDVQGGEHIPRNGPYLLVSNHIGYFDPVVIGSVIPQQIHFMAKSTSFRVPFLGPLIRSLNAFPVERDTPDRSALKRAIEILTSGGVVGIFPMGGIVKNNQRVKAKDGTSFIARKAGVPLLPMYIEGTRQLYGFKWLLPGRVKITVRIGDPFMLETNDGASAKEHRTRLGSVIIDRIFELQPRN